MSQAELMIHVSNSSNFFLESLRFSFTFQVSFLFIFYVVPGIAGKLGDSAEVRLRRLYRNQVTKKVVWVKYSMIVKGDFNSQSRLISHLNWQADIILFLE